MKPTLKVRRLSGDNLSAQKALESTRAATKTVNPPSSALQQGPLQVRLPTGASSVVIKQILPPNTQEQHKATVQPQQMQNSMLTPDSEIQDVNPTEFPVNPVKPWTKSLSVKMTEAAQKQLHICNKLHRKHEKTFRIP